MRPGLTKLTWAAQGNLDQFVHDCRTHAQKVTKVIEDYKSSNRNIGQHCREICEMLMVKLDERRVFEGDEFYLEQKLHRETMLVRVKAAYKEIVLKMHKSAEVFRGDAGDVQTHWIKYTEKMDHMVEEALRLNIKWSLQELSKAINGDGKTSPNPLFKVKVVLNDKQVSNCIHTYIRIYVCLYATYMHTYVHTHIHTYVLYIRTCMYIRTCICTYIQMCTQAHMVEMHPVVSCGIYSFQVIMGFINN